MTGEELDIIPTKFRFLRPSPDGSIVRVVYSFPAGTMGDGAKIDKTQPKFAILEFSPDKSRKSPCLKIYPPQKLAVGAETGRYEIATGFALAMTACCGMLRAFSCGGNIGQRKGVVVRLVRLVRETWGLRLEA